MEASIGRNNREPNPRTGTRASLQFTTTIQERRKNERIARGIVKGKLVSNVASSQNLSICTRYLGLKRSTSCKKAKNVASETRYGTTLPIKRFNK
jgi:hypothetical protein